VSIIGHQLHNIGASYPVVNLHCPVLHDTCVTPRSCARTR
jgi:hypothetical protein